MSDNQWKIVFAAVAAVAAFVLSQSDVTVVPIVKVALGALIVALSVINPNRASA